MPTGIATVVQQRYAEALKMKPLAANQWLCDGLKEAADRESAAKLAKLPASDWEAVMQQAIRHGVAPLLYHRLEPFRSSYLIPDEMWQKLHHIYLQSAGRNVRQFHQLTDILALLQRHKIPVVVLKGAHLAEIVYGDIALRPMTDIDLLFQQNNLAAAQKRLLAAGYLAQKHKFPVLDLHSRLDDSLAEIKIDMAEVWQRAEPATIAGVQVLVLAPEDLLLHLCLHLAFHHLFQFAGLRALCDIAETIRCYRAQLQWAQVETRAKQWQAGNAVYLALSLAKDLVGAQVPDNVLTNLTPYEITPQVQTWAITQIFQEGYNAPPLSPYFVQLWQAGPLQQKLFLLRRLIFPSSQTVTQKYPVILGSTQNYLYYFIRVKDHFVRYGRTTWRILTGDQNTISWIKQQQRNMAIMKWLSSD